nr:MAG TPA: hypothetical protein [Caudoviricetes sp.]
MENKYGEENQRICFHYLNFQPLRKKDNLKREIQFLLIIWKE